MKKLDKEVSTSYTYHCRALSMKIIGILNILYFKTKKVELVTSCV